MVNGYMTNNATKYGKVAVLMGGMSAEREISLQSGNAVLAALTSSGVNAHAVDVGEDVIHQLINGGYDRAFNMLHGRVGEDGVIQGALELLGIPYTGSGVLASALGMDKLRSKEIWLANDLPTPPFYVVDENTIPEHVVDALGLPIIIKPLREGSSIGMSKVNKLEELAPAIENALQYDNMILAEKWIEGDEYTAAIVCDQSMPLIRLETANVFYDYEAKYLSNDTKYHCPCGLDSDKEFEFQKLAHQAFKMIGAKGWGRVDMMVDRDGIDFNGLVMKILDCSFERG